MTRSANLSCHKLILFCITSNDIILNVLTHQNFLVQVHLMRKSLMLNFSRLNLQIFFIYDCISETIPMGHINFVEKKRKISYWTRTQDNNWVCLTLSQITFHITKCLVRTFRLRTYIFFSPKKKCFTAWYVMWYGYERWIDMQIRTENTLLLRLVFDEVSECKMKEFKLKMFYVRRTQWLHSKSDLKL